MPPLPENTRFSLASRLSDLKITQPKNYQLADTFYENLQEQIKDREAELKSNEELELVYKDRGGENITITSIGYHNPFTMIFAGRDHDNNEIEILTHMASVELLVRTVQSSNPKNRRTIGFHGSSETEVVDEDKKK
jgi:hypothetical protein